MLDQPARVAGTVILTVLDLILIGFVLYDIYNKGEVKKREAEEAAKEEGEQATGPKLEEIKVDPKDKKDGKSKKPADDKSKKVEEEVEEEPLQLEADKRKSKGCCKVFKSLMVYTFTDSSTFDAINLLMNFSSLVNIGLKIGYDIKYTEL